MSIEANLGVRADHLLERLIRLGSRLAVAESLTGGLLADALVSVPGASGAFSGGVVAYDTRLKASILGVDRSLLEQHGPVNEAVAMQMARGVRQTCALSDEQGFARDADVGLATTGVAGPDPDPQTGQPAGTVWIGVSSRLGERALKLSLKGDRDQVRMRSVSAALEALSQEIMKLESR